MAGGDTLATNRPDWKVIHEDIANISCLDLEGSIRRIEEGTLDLQT